MLSSIGLDNDLSVPSGQVGLSSDFFNQFGFCHGVHLIGIGIGSRLGAILVQDSSDLESPSREVQKGYLFFRGVITLGSPEHLTIFGGGRRWRLGCAKFTTRPFCLASWPV